MAGAFSAAGAQGKASKSAPLFTRKFWTGLYTNGSALGDPATPYLYEKFYSGTRYDHLVDGLNCEVTPQYSLARSPGHSVYNSQTFPAIDSFYTFRTFTINSSRIYVMADTASTVYDATGPSTKTAIFTKSAGAQQTFFQSIGNVLYFANGVDSKKWLPSLASFNGFGNFLSGTGSLVLPGPRGQNRTHPIGSLAINYGDMLIDSNGNIQICIVGGLGATTDPTWNVSLLGTTTDDSGAGQPVTWRNHGGLVQNWGVVAPLLAPTVTAPTSPDIFQVRFWMPNHTYGIGASLLYVVLTPNGHMQRLVDGTKTTGSTYPVWNESQGQTKDGTATWEDLGSMFTIPQVKALGGGLTGQHAALNVTIIDFNGNIQTVTTAGNEGSNLDTVVFGSGNGTTTVDGGITWTCYGTAAICVQQGYTYYNSYFAVGGQFSNCSPAAQTTGPVFGLNYSATIGNGGSSDIQVVQNVVFRTTDGGVTPFGKVTDGSAVENHNLSWTMVDTTPDRLLDITIIGVTDLRNSPPPPSGTIYGKYTSVGVGGPINVTEHLGRIWGSTGNVVYYSMPANATIGIGWESWPPLQSYTMKDTVIRLHSTAIGIIVFTLSGAHIIPTIAATGLPAPTPYPFIPGTGLANWNAFAENGSSLFILTTSGNLIAIDASAGVTYVGHPIANLLKLLPRSTSYLTYHEDGEDIAMYASDGATGWYRLSQVSAPETGIIWSPRRAIVHRALASVEITPGVKKLLLGPATSGPILQRDSTVNTDNGSTYSWFGTVGTLVLAQPGQMAEVEFMSTICKKTGSSPTVGVIVDEISGTFSTLSKTSQESPFKFSSSTLLMDRWDMKSSGTPAKMMFAQVKLAFPAEDARNEVLAYSMFGSHWQQK